MLMHKKSCHLYCVVINLLVVTTFVFSACSPAHQYEVDKLNSQSYAFHYRNLDSVKVLAKRALALSDDYSTGYAEACNNLAFVAIAKMNYKQAKQWLNLVEERSDNQIELLIADVQNMRLCQREARNKDFYAYREKAKRRLRRISEEINNLPSRAYQRAVYAQSEFAVVASTYFYYVQLEKPMIQALDQIDPDVLEQDTAQYLNYLYNYGSGGAITHGTHHEILQAEFDMLIRCYMLASGPNPYPYWQANALQAISEHIQDEDNRDFLIKNNLPAFQYLNVEQMPANLLAGNFAQRSLNLFSSYGDVYQTAGAHRTLAECYWQIKDYQSALVCLNHALYDNKAIFQAPDLVASIREQMSLAYSAQDDKPKSDYNRNAYLDLQESSRQDRQLEARAAQLDSIATTLNIMIIAVIAMIVIAVILLYIFDYMKRKKSKQDSTEDLLKPLHECTERNVQKHKEFVEEFEEKTEKHMQLKMRVLTNKERNVEQRAKVQFANSILTFIDRMLNEVSRLCTGGEPEKVRKERYQYMLELVDIIDRYNGTLTRWIQMKQGMLNLRVESFELQQLFDIVEKGKTSFEMKGIKLVVKPTDIVLKADRALTLFMINTIADNARKFTPPGGKVVIEAEHVADHCVEISITDDGEGMNAEQLAHVFDRTYSGGHGFGLINCKGIIEKYKKLSRMFSKCDISVQSEMGKGSRFAFRLPEADLTFFGSRRISHLGSLVSPVDCSGKSDTSSAASSGVVKVLLALLLALFSWLPSANTWAKIQKAPSGHHQHRRAAVQKTLNLQRADQFADSAYFSNVNGHYERTLVFADSARAYLNRHYLSLHPQGTFLMVKYPKSGAIAELQWLRDSLPTDYNVILDIRNETAVAALALHRWDLYDSNNKVYTQLFRKMSADNTLDDYVRTMEVSKNSKNVAVVLLILLLLQLPLAYYLLYYRHILRYRFAVDKVNTINQILLSSSSDKEKLKRISEIWDEKTSRRANSKQLKEVVERIEKALHDGMEDDQKDFRNLELLEDDIHRAEYEGDKLYVANQVLDNCLSALKHETMYYPSRIRQLIETRHDDVESLRELIEYYKSIYTMLSMQAMEQAKGMARLDYHLMERLFEILMGTAKKCDIEISARDGNPYASVYVVQHDSPYDEMQLYNFFSSLTVDVNYLVASQIVREVGDITNMRACGLRACLVDDGNAQITVVLPAEIVKKIDFEGIRERLKHRIEITIKENT